MAQNQKKGRNKEEEAAALGTTKQHALRYEAANQAKVLMLQTAGHWRCPPDKQESFLSQLFSNPLPKA